MNTTELKALAEDLQTNHEYCPKEVILKAAASILELIAANEDAQGEIRALRATEAGLRDRLAQVEAEHAAPAQPAQQERKPMTDEHETRVMKLMGVIDDLIEADPDRAERLIESILARNALRKRLEARHHGIKEQT